MSNDFLEPRRRGRAALIVAGGVALLLIAISATAAVTARAVGRTDVPAGAGAAAEASVSPARDGGPEADGESAGTGEDEQSTSAASAPLRLPRGRMVISNVEVGYPHTKAGAVAAAVEYTAQMGTLDPDRAAAIGRLIADDSIAEAPDRFAKSRLDMRRALGLTTSGPVPPGASFELSPAAYQLRDASADSVTVLLLIYFVTTTPQAGTVNRVVVFGNRMHWNGLDWKFAEPPDGDYAALRVRPGTGDAEAVGWREWRR